MSSGHFARSSRNTPQRNPNKSQQATEASTNPSQISGITVEQNNKNGYVYRPPTKIMRSNINAVKEQVQQKVQVKKQQTSKPLSFVRKPVNETQKPPVVEAENTQAKEQVKPIVKPVSRLTVNRTNDPLATFGQQKTQQNKNLTINSEPNSSELLDVSSKSSNTVVEAKKPSPFSYPKRVSRKGPQSESQSQQNLQTNQHEQPVQQTPKFNRFPKEDKEENPSVSNFQIQRKNAPTTGVQSVNNLKPSPNIISSRVQNIDSPKTLQSSSKSSISHASRYSNIERKIETPTNKKQQMKSEQQVSTKPVKRSPIVAFSLHRLYLHRVHSIFNQVHQLSKHIKDTKSNQTHFKLVERTLLKFAKNFQKNTLTRAVFGLLKSINSKAVKLQMTRSNDPKISNQLILSRNKCFGRVFENIVVSDLILVRDTFKALRSILNEKKIVEKKILYGAKVLGNLESRRIKQSMKQIFEWASTKNVSKGLKLSRCSEINLKYKKFLLWEAFKSISLFKLKQLASQIKLNSHIQKQPSKPLPSQQISHDQSETNKQLKTKISELQSKLSQLSQTSSQIPKQSDLRKALQQLKESKEQNSQQLELRKQRNQQLKKMFESLTDNKAFSSQQEFDSLSENKMQNQQPTLSLLHQIYMKTYKQSEQQCIAEENISSLCVIHRVDQNKLLREIVAKWLAVEQNLTLKHEINLYQGNYLSESNESGIVNNIRKVGKQLQEQNQIIRKFIRSYIKERYMWEEVKQYVAAVIVE